MAWEDRSRAEKREERKQARELAKIDAADGNRTYVVITGKGTRITVKGITSAQAVAGKDGTYKPK